MTIEQILREKVFGKRIKYTTKDMYLHLTGYDGTEFRFKKVD